jgi:hypothetical protein
MHGSDFLVGNCEGRRRELGIQISEADERLQAPEAHYFGQDFLFHQLVSSWLLQSLYTVLLRTMPSAVHKQGILFGLGSLARPGQSAAVYAHQQQSYSAGDAVVEVELCVNVSSKFGYIVI